MQESPISRQLLDALGLKRVKSRIILRTKRPKIVYGWGLRCGSLGRSPRTLSRLGRGHPFPIPLPLDAFGRCLWGTEWKDGLDMSQFVKRGCALAEE